MSGLRDRIAEKLKDFRYESSAYGVERSLMEHHIEALSDFLSSDDFIAVFEGPGHFRRATDIDLSTTGGPDQCFACLTELVDGECPECREAV